MYGIKQPPKTAQNPSSTRDTLFNPFLPFTWNHLDTHPYTICFIMFGTMESAVSQNNVKLMGFLTFWRRLQAAQ